MPLEVRELVIRAQVPPPPAPASVRVAQLTPAALAQLKRELVAQCLAELRRRQATVAER